jgi:dihydrofolate reductase (trimethoprim resistance protein)
MDLIEALKQCQANLDKMYVQLENRPQTFMRGDLVRKKSGSRWQGRVVGEYSTLLTPEGYAVESDSHAGSVQIYPVTALEACTPPTIALPPLPLPDYLLAMPANDEYRAEITDEYGYTAQQMVEYATAALQAAGVQVTP